MTKVSTTALDTAILAPVYGTTSVTDVIENWHRQEHTGRLADCHEQPCMEFVRTVKHPTPTHVVEEWHREVHIGRFEYCDQQPCHAVATYDRMSDL